MAKGVIGVVHAGWFKRGASHICQHTK